MHIPAWEQALFYGLTFLSLGIMVWQFLQRARVWRQGKPTDWRHDWRRSLANVWTFVFKQKKVRTHRKRTGAPMHLLIFFGFLSLFLATTLLAIATYSPLGNFHRGTYYLVYEAVFDALGLLFIVGLVWALVRRARLEGRDLGPASLREEPVTEAGKAEYERQAVHRRRKPLSSAWQDYATLGLLLLLGVTGYWLEASRISNDPQTWDKASIVGWSWAQLQGPVSAGFYRFVWWFHVFWVLVFFAVLPRMRIRHLVIAFLSSAGKPEQPMGELRPISLEEVEQTEKIGVSHARDYSRWHLMSLDACMECGRCTEVCPAWNVGKVLNPKQVVQDLRRAEVTQEAVADAVSEEALWACTTCNACVEACPVLIRHVDLIVDARRNLVAEGRLAGSGALVLRQIGSTGSAWGGATDREGWMKDLDVPLAREKGSFEYLFWVGCAGATDLGAIRTTRAFAGLLSRAGVDFACLGNEERCTGDPARRIGEEFLFQEQAQGLVPVFEKYGVRKIVTTCPHCMNTLRNEYPQFEGRYEVVHHTELLAELIRQGKLRAAGADGTVYHDPCYLARVNDQSDAPRSLLGERTQLNGASPEIGPMRHGALSEPAHHGRKTLCCGAGGGRMWMEEAPDQRPGNRRAEELLATGAKTIAVSCPFCRIMLDASVKSVTEEEVRLVDLAEMLSEANA